ncbi:hypothetical protein PENSPDRAFT_758717 [Peniophora sp. CONT]|nr:hypothetical protein PENSPDRAFT_758717 [Peniophora sp. CONT]
MPNFRDSASSCDVCLEPYREGEPHRMQHILVPCGHMYCLSCVNGLARGLCPSCREPIQQHIRVYNDPPRAVLPSQLLLDTKNNVEKACVNLDRYPGLDSDFSDRIDDLLALCVPKEESEDRIIPVLQAIEKLINGFKEAHSIAAREVHTMRRNLKLAAEGEEARNKALTEVLLDDVEILKSRLKAYETAFPVAPDMPRLSKRLPPIIAPEPIFGHVDPLAPGVFYFVGPSPGRGVKLGSSTSMPGTPRTPRDLLLQSYQNRAADKVDEAEREAETRRRNMPGYIPTPPARHLLHNTDGYAQDTASFSTFDALGLQPSQPSQSPVGLGLAFDGGGSISTFPL